MVLTALITERFVVYIGTIPGGDGGGVVFPKFGRVGYISFHPPPQKKIYNYRKTLSRSRLCERPTEILSKDVRECDRELSYFYTVKRMRVYFPTQCFSIAKPI